jgi:hypothetical protein
MVGDGIILPSDQLQQTNLYKIPYFQTLHRTIHTVYSPGLRFSYM